HSVLPSFPTRRSSDLNDPRSPFVTSGLRIGTPAVTTRGFKEAECRELAGWICDILDDLNNEAVIDAVRAKVQDLCKRFPVYKNRSEEHTSELQSRENL